MNDLILFTVPYPGRWPREAKNLIPLGELPPVRVRVTEHVLTQEEATGQQPFWAEPEIEGEVEEEVTT